MNDNWGFSDEDLDGIFRQAAEGQRPRFEPEDWRHMAARLDEAGSDGVPPPVRPWYKRWSWLVLVGLLLLTGLTVWLYPTADRLGATRPASTPAQPTATATNREVPAESPRHPVGNETARPAADANKRTNGADATSRASILATRTENPVAGPDSKKPGRLTVKATVNAGNGTTTSHTAQPGTPVSETVSGGKTSGNGRDRQSAAPGESSNASAPGRGIASNVVSSKKEGRGNRPNASLKRPLPGGQPKREVTVARQNRTVPPLGQMRENTPVVAGQSTRPQLVTRRANDERTAGRRQWENGPEFRREWQTPNLARLSTRRISFRKINLPVEEPALSQFSSYYTPPHAGPR